MEYTREYRRTFAHHYVLVHLTCLYLSVLMLRYCCQIFCDSLQSRSKAYDYQIMSKEDSVTETYQLDVVISIDQDVLRLQILMDYSF